MWGVIRKIGAGALALCVAVACGKEAQGGPEAQGSLVRRSFRLAAGPVSRSYVDGLSIMWDSDDDSMLYYDDGSGFRMAESTGTTLSQGGKFCEFDFELTVARQAKTVQICSVCPAAAVEGEQPESVTLTLPQNQMPGADSYDKAAAIILGQYKEGVSLQDGCQCGYSFRSALSKITFGGIPQDEKIVSVEVNSPGARICGTASANLKSAVISADSDSTMLRLGYEVPLESRDCWMSSWAVASGTELEISAYTADKVYKKTITLNKGIESGMLNTMSVDMSGLGAANPLVGDFIIAAQGQDNAFYVYLPGGPQKTEANTLDEIASRADAASLVWEIRKAPFGYTLTKGETVIEAYIEPFHKGYLVSYLTGGNLTFAPKDVGIINFVGVN